MSDDVVERVARALCRQYEIDDGFSPEQADRAAASDMHRNFLRAARAAIEAMRDPPQSMIDHHTHQSGEWCRRNIEAFVDAALGDSVTVELPEAHKTL